MRSFLLATVIGFGQLSLQVQTQLSSQNVSLGQDVTFVNHSVVATSPTFPGLRYTAKTVVPLVGYIPGALYVVTIDRPNQAGATLDLGPGPMPFLGTCSTMCIVLVQSATSSAPAAWLVK